MGRKSKYTIEEKLQAVLDYKNGVRGKSQICNDLGLNLSGTDLYRWVKHYDKYGEIAFHPKERNKEYSKEFKEMVVREFLDGKGTTRDLCYKRDFLSIATLLNCVYSYNSHE